MLLCIPPGDSSHSSVLGRAHPDLSLLIKDVCSFTYQTIQIPFFQQYRKSSVSRRKQSVTFDSSAFSLVLEKAGEAPSFNNAFMFLRKWRTLTYNTVSILVNGSSLCWGNSEEHPGMKYRLQNHLLNERLPRGNGRRHRIQQPICVIIGHVPNILSVPSFRSTDVVLSPQTYCPKLTTVAQRTIQKHFLS